MIPTELNSANALLLSTRKRRLRTSGHEMQDGNMLRRRRFQISKSYDLSGIGKLPPRHLCDVNVNRNGRRTKRRPDSLRETAPYRVPSRITQLVEVFERRRKLTKDAFLSAHGATVFDPAIPVASCASLSLTRRGFAHQRSSQWRETIDRRATAHRRSKLDRYHQTRGERTGTPA